MHSDHHILCPWCVFILIMLTISACTTITATHISQISPAILVGNASCHEEIKEAIEKMAGLERFHISPDVFSNKSLLLLSNFIPAELLQEKHQPFSKTADKRFVLHKKNKTCFLSLVDANMTIIKTTCLKTCQCEKID